MIAAYSPRVRPGTTVSFPVSWVELDRVTPTDFTIHTVPALLRGGNPWAEYLPEPQSLPADLIEEGRAIPAARVQAMHEGKRRASARRRALELSATSRMFAGSHTRRWESTPGLAAADAGQARNRELQLLAAGVTPIEPFAQLV